MPSYVFKLMCFFLSVLAYSLRRERGETPSPVSSIQRLSQQDAEGYARLRSLQRHRRPSYSQSSLEVREINYFSQENLIKLLLWIFIVRS